ncbi:MAG: methyltransferase [Bdellovibrio sp.]|nr:methyltransferase [Bdellovibrio sp.]
MKKSFKDWMIPGPAVPGVSQDSAVPEDQSLDALSGHFKIYQYRAGHRYSTDDLLVAWYGTSFCGSAKKVLDLGSGIGSVGMIAAWRLPGAEFVTIEAQDISVQLAQKSIRYNGLESRYEIRCGDFRDSETLSGKERFDLILGSPPYFPMEDGLLGNHPQKISCRFEMRGSILDYASVASKHLTPGGVFACIFPVAPKHQRDRVNQAAQEAGFTILRTRDVVLKEGEPPLLALFLMTLSSDIPEAYREKTWHENPLMIRQKDGSIHPEYSVIKMSIGFPP